MVLSISVRFTRALDLEKLDDSEIFIIRTRSERNSYIDKAFELA